MSDLRRNVLGEAKRIVIKIGSRILVDSARNGVREDYIGKLAHSVARLVEGGKEVIIVTSGAVGTGMAILGYREKPKVLSEKQACAAVGQIGLMHSYREKFLAENLPVGQILLSADDFRDRTRYKNLQNTLHTMIDKGIVPLINENDSLAVKELNAIGDNDKLSSDVALFFDADLLLVFTDEDGLFNDNPKKNPKARLLRFVPEITPEIMALTGKPGESGSAVSTGGMRSKVESIRAVVKSGCNAFLANGLKVFPDEIVFGDALGTLFIGNRKKLGSRKRWLSFISSPSGSVVVDAGCILALRKKHSSLLPVGVVAIRRHFSAGDLIEVLSESGEKVARGISQMDSANLKLVLHEKTSQVRSKLGGNVPEEVIHKNNLVVF